MNILSTAIYPNPLEDSGNNFCPACFSLREEADKDEEDYGFSTIDGSMLSFMEGSTAVSIGTGIFVGDYFVGIQDNIHSFSNTPFIRY